MEKRFFFSKNKSVFCLLKLTSNLATYVFCINCSSLILNESIKFLISETFTFVNFCSWFETTVIFDNFINASLNALLMTISFSKFTSNGSVISILFTLKIDDFKSEVVKFRNRTDMKKII